MQGILIAKVFVDKVCYQIDQAYDYLVPIFLQESLLRGCRIIVPFGAGNKKVQGLVDSIEVVLKVDPRTKTIFSQIDSEPILSEEMFSMIYFLQKNTFCTYYEAVKTVLPLGTNTEIVESFQLSEQAKQLSQMQRLQFNEYEQRLLDFLVTVKTSKEISSFFGKNMELSIKAAIKLLLEKEIITKSDKITSRVAKKTVKMVRITDGLNVAELKLPPKQKEVMEKLSDIKTVMVKELCYLCGVTDIVIKNLAKKRMVEFFDKEMKNEFVEAYVENVDSNDIDLSEEQQSVYEGLMTLVHENTPKVALLYGVTGSGKTQIYIKLIAKVLSEGKSAILLVPEIALTPQMVQKFKSIFGEIVAVIHSGLTYVERLGEFNKIRANMIKIVIGTRSAIFSPLENIGIIILDEEGEASYKSDSPPRYHAREVAKLRCVNHNALLVLGSATPSIDSFYQAKLGKYSFFKVENRFKNATLPNVYIVDMLEEQKQQNFSPISEVLRQQLLLNLKQGEQSIILLNRRGYNTYATCMECGEVVTCPHCDVAMTFHKANGYLMCHYCGHTKKFDKKCPSCGGEYIKLTGAGTQKIEDELQFLYPSARLLRMDTDTTFSKFAYEKNFADFRAGKYDIMVGTQMIAKGLDFPNVTLVGVINADSGLYSADFKSSERVFSLITQVVGRSGRSEKSGRAYIQTMNPNDSVISMAANQDYNAFYDDEIAIRKELMCPPFCDICVIGFSGTKEENVKIAANRAMQILKDTVNSSKEPITLKVLGVTPANILKINNKYRYRIIIKCKFNNKFKAFMSTVLKLFAKEKQMRGISIYADINGDIGG